MKLLRKVKIMIATVSSFTKVRLWQKKIPLVVGWAITYRCNRKCPYCGLGQLNYDELSTGQILNIVNQLAGLGALRISFTGGEPLLRDDIGEIIDYIHKIGIEAKINSNGSLVKEKIKDLINLDILNLSLEGPPEIHDAIRGEGSYQEVMEAVRSAQDSGIKVNFSTVLTGINLKAIDFILGKAEEFLCKTVFQPATGIILGGNAPNPLAPSQKEYRQAIERLIKEKKAGNRHIGNSLTGLRHLRYWPNPKKIKCASGWISCRIEPNADVVYCSREKQPAQTLNCLREGFPTAFKNLQAISCADCWCAARVELNRAFYGDLTAIFEQMGS